LAIDGADGAFTVIEAFAVLPAPPSLEVTAAVTLFFVPALVAVTLTENVQLALAASVALEREALLFPAPAVMVPPPHDPITTLGVATTRPVGKLSVKPTPVSCEAFGLLMVKDSVVLWPILIDAAPNTLLIDGGEGALTPIEAVAALPGSLSLEVTVLVVLFFAPAVVAVTFTENVQLAPATSVAPVRDALPAPAFACSDC
jgi:hypothetical protein